jgi:D-amino peptidase
MQFARGQAVREANAAIRALFDSGAEKVVVWDSHSDGVNLAFEELDPRCEVLLGFGFAKRFPELDETYTGVLMIGYHAMEGTRNAVLAHTYSSDVYRAIRVNGHEFGEIALDAAVAGELGVPLIFVSSDDKGCEEALRIMPWVDVVKTKTGYGHNCAFSKHPLVTEEEIYRSVSLAVERIAEKKVFTCTAPVQIEVEFKKCLQMLRARIRRHGWRVAGPRTIKAELKSMQHWVC